MAYTPLQLSVFNAAFEGAMFGFVSDAAPNDPAAADYLTLMNSALAYAQEFDTTYGVTGASDALTLQSIVQCSAGYMTGRTQTSSNPLDFLSSVLTVIAMVQEANTAEAAFLTLQGSQLTSFRARNVRQTNLATLGVYAVAAAASNDNVLNVQGDIVLLVAQTTAKENGPYQVGAVVAGNAPLTRPSWWQAGQVFKTGALIVLGGEGTIFRNTTWESMLVADSFTVDTSDPELFPRMVTFQQALVAGQLVNTTIPLRSVKSGIGISRTTANTAAATIQYQPTIAGNTGLVAGAIGTASLTIQSCIAAGTINNADVSTLNVTVNNQL